MVREGSLRFPRDKLRLLLHCVQDMPRDRFGIGNWGMAGSRFFAARRGRIRVVHRGMGNLHDLL
jgi:hypothetical protein